MLLKCSFSRAYCSRSHSQAIPMQTYNNVAHIQKQSKCLFFFPFLQICRDNCDSSVQTTQPVPLISHSERQLWGFPLADGSAEVTAGVSLHRWGCCWPSSSSVRADSSRATHPLPCSATARSLSLCWCCWPAVTQLRFSILVQPISNLVQPTSLSWRLLHTQNTLTIRGWIYSSN